MEEWTKNASLKRETKTKLPKIPKEHLVNSTQIHSLPKGWDAEKAILYYFQWLEELFFPFLTVVRKGTEVIISIAFLNIPLLVLTQYQDRTTKNRIIYTITGGILGHKKEGGFLEFREIYSQRYIMTSIQDFSPKLPWFIYKYTQAIGHKWTMWRFKKTMEFLTNPY
jgi:hypothetical protein